MLLRKAGRKNPVMTIRFDDIGNRLKAFRLASGLSADEIAARLHISRTALYRFEKGEVAKIETLEKLSELLDVSVPTLLGVGVEGLRETDIIFDHRRPVHVFDRRRRPGASLTVRSIVVVVLGYFTHTILSTSGP